MEKAEEESNVLNDLLECASKAINNLDTNDREDAAIILGLLECCQTAMMLPAKKRKWVKAYREERKLLSYANEMESLGIDEENSEILLSLVKEDLTRKNTLMRGAIPAEVRLLAIVRSVITGESYRATDAYTGLSQSFICCETPRVCQAIWKNLKDTYLKFPSTTAEWEAIAKEFEDKWQFPNCIGALAGKHISFRCRRTDASFYQNKMGTSSIILLALVDANFRFLYADVGSNGSLNDFAAFEQSTLKKVLEDEGTNLPSDRSIGASNQRKLPYVMLGGESFPLKRHLMKPFAINRSQTEEHWEDKRIFNKRLHHARVVAEHAFDLLFSRFKIFRTILNLRVENIEIVTMACCVLHNFLIQNDDNYQQCFQDMIEESAEGNCTSNTAYDFHHESEEAARIRLDFMTYFKEEEEEIWIDGEL